MSGVREIAPIIVDPRHERFGQMGKMDFLGVADDGTCGITFEDGEEISVNAGHSTGIPQFVSLLKADGDKVEQLITALPALRPQLEDIASQVQEPLTYPLKPGTIAASKRFRTLIHKVLDRET
jgi:hypothetical protein